MSLTSTAVRRPIGTAMIYLAVIVLGAVSLRSLSVDLLPKADFPRISITTEYEGVAPQEIETLLTRPIEQAVSTLDGIDRIEAISAEGLSRVSLRFVWGADLDRAVNDVRAALDRVRPRLPDAISPPMVFKFDLSDIPVAVLGLRGGGDPRTLKRLAIEVLSPRLERLPGIASVSVSGGRDREIRVELDASRLSALGVRPEDVSQALARENRTVSAGDMRETGREVAIRTVGEFRDLDEIAAVVVAEREGRAVRVRDVGAVVDATREAKSELFLDGGRGIRLRVAKQAGANTIDVVRGLRAEMTRLNREYEGRAELSMLRDTADFVERSVANVRSGALVGSLLSVFVLLLFLRSVRATTVVATAIPVSILATFALMYGAGISLNIISFGGLALGIGMLVDGAIVILENIHRRHEAGDEPAEAATRGAREVGSAVIAGTVTTLAVFVPVIFIPGMPGVFFRELSLVVAFSLLCSLAVALTLVPALSAQLFARAGRTEGGRASEGLARGLEGAFARLDRAYEALVARALARPWSIVLVAGLAFGLSIFGARFVSAELIPETDEGQLVVDVELPPGTPLERTTAMMIDLESKVRDALIDGEVEHLVVTAGPESFFRPAGSNQGSIDVSLVSRSRRKRSIEAIQAAVREAVADVPGPEIRVRKTSSDVLSRVMRGGGEDRLSVEIRGYDLATAHRLGEEIVELARAIPGVTHARIDREMGQLERVLRVDRDRAAELGIGSAEVASAVEHYVLGKVATRFRDRGDEFDVRVQLRLEDRQRLDRLEGLPMFGPSGAQVPLSALVRVDEVRGPTSIARLNQERVLRVSGGLGDRPLGEVASEMQAKLRTLVVPEGFSVTVAGEAEEQASAFSSLYVGVFLALFLVYAAMAIQFESLRHPFVVMLSVPFAFVGVVLTLLVTATTLNMNSLLGAIVLVGIVVNNAIVLVDYTNLLRRERSMPLVPALREAGRTRLRPILMTTLTTLIAMIPLALGIGEGGEIQAPLARVVLGGLLVSTMVTLVLVPCVYYLVERGSERRSSFVERAREERRAA